MTVVLGVDPGVTVGLCLLEAEDDEWRCLRRWQFRSSHHDRGHALDDLTNQLWDTLNEHNTIEAVAMEAFKSYGKNSAAEKVEAEAIIKLFAHQARLPLCEYAPGTVRSVICGNGKASSASIGQTVRYLLRLPKVAKRGFALTEHQKDAFSVALTHLMRQGAISVLDRCREVDDGS